MAALRKAWNPKLNFDDISWIIEKQITSMTNAHMYTFVVCNGLVFEAEVLTLRHGYLLQLSWRMVPGSATRRRVQAQVRTPPSNWLHEMAI